MNDFSQRVDENDDSDDVMEDQDEGDDQDGTASEAGSGTSDLIVLGLPWSANEADIRDYFETFGPLAMVQLKMGQQGKSKGFAFIRYKEMEPQAKVLLTRHMIKDRSVFHFLLVCSGHKWIFRLKLQLFGLVLSLQKAKNSIF